MEVKYIEIPKIADERGSLSFMESDNHIPFNIKRVYYIQNLKDDGEKRGEHAHYETQQVLFCINGKVKIGLDDGKEKRVVELSQSNRGVLIPKLVWHWMEGFENNCILLVIASDAYKESDYIRQYTDFLNYIR